MAKRQLVDHRNDFTGGLNTESSPDALQPNELTQLLNGRLLQTSFGATQSPGSVTAITQRQGTRRIHATAVGTVGDRVIDGMVQWESPGDGKQLVVIAGGRLYHKLVDAGDFVTAENNFAAGNVLDAVSETAEVNLTPAAAPDDTYTVHYSVSVTANQAAPSTLNTVQITVAIDTDDGGGWVERAAFPYLAVADDTEPQTVVSSHVDKTIVVAGLGDNDDLRLRIKSVSLDQGGSFSVHGFNKPTDGNPHAGVTYSAGTGVDFTEVDPTPDINGGRISFATFRGSGSGAFLRLYFAAGGQIWRWTGSSDTPATTLTKIDGTASVPAASILRSYGTRLWAAGVSTFPKHLFWSKIGDAENFATGGEADGGSAMVDVLTGDAISSLETIGSSLVVFTKDAVVRVTGVSNLDIQIEQDTAGIAPALGVEHIYATTPLDTLGAMVTARGVYLVAEGQLTPVSAKVMSLLVQAVGEGASTNVMLAPHYANAELWVQISATDILVYSLAYRCWSLFRFPFNVTCMARFRSTTYSRDGLVLGGDDGFVRTVDSDINLDDVLNAGSGGSLYTLTADLAPMVFEQPTRRKILHRFYATVSRGSLVVERQFDNGTFISAGTATNSNTAPLPVRLDANDQGRRLYVRVSNAAGGADTVRLHALTVEAFETGRPD